MMSAIRSMLLHYGPWDKGNLSSAFLQHQVTAGCDACPRMSLWSNQLATAGRPGLRIL
jgi:hypothetical protein